MEKPQAEVPLPPNDVAAVFDSYDDPIRSGLLNLRRLILETAQDIDGVGALEETLKWGQPSYLTSESGSGSTVRIAPTNAKSKHDFALFVTCSTTLVSDFKAQFGDSFTYEGKRALEFSIGDAIPETELRECIAMALTYKQR